MGGVSRKDVSDDMAPEVLDLVAERFRLLAEPQRLRILQALQGGERSVTELAAAVGTTQPNVSKHLRLLQDGGLLARRQQGNTVYYAIDDPTILELCDLVCSRLQARLAAQARAMARGSFRNPRPSSG